MIVASTFAETLRALGVRRAYGLPGEDHMTLLDAIDAAGIEYHTAFNESSAVIMAGADARITGEPAVVVLSLAPGISNAYNGLLHAYMEGLPIVVVSGDHDAAREPLVVRQGFDLDTLMAPVTKWRGAIAPGADVQLMTMKAFDIATAERPGPVFLRLPDYVAKAEDGKPGGPDRMSMLTEQWADRGYQRVTVAPPTERAYAGLRDLIGAAKRPVLIVGGRRFDVTRETVDAFAERFACPVFTTTGQKGLVDPATPMFAGTFLNGSLEASILSRADLILFVNPESYDIYNTPWKYDGPTVAISGVALGEWIQAFDRRVVADPEATLRALAGADATGDGPGRSSEWTADEVAGYRANVRGRLLDGFGDRLTVPVAVDAALSAAPAGVRLLADAGFGKPPAALISEPTGRAAFLASNALSTMGFAIPAAIGAIRAERRPVLCFLGDGSLLMRATELAAVRAATVPLVTVALMDGALTQIGVKQERRALATVGVALPDISCADLGRALGIEGADVSTADDLRKAVADGFTAGGPMLIGARVDAQASRDLFGVLRG